LKGQILKKTILLWLVILAVPVFGQSNSKKQLAQLLPITEEEVPGLLASLKGNVVLVNFWATWCGPCVKEFPNLVRLQKLYKEKGVAVVFISVDEPEDAETTVRPFLKKENVTFTSYIKNGDDESFIDAFGKGWRGAIPTTFVYDRAGKQVAALTGERDYKMFERVIEPHLE
jgi:thiol-disulfide isomerase/thioredoxin